MGEKHTLPVFDDPELPEGVTRRDFFRVMGLSAGAATLACTRAPVREAIPFATASEEIVPGEALHYASTCGACPAACGILVKTRDGRPIKIAGNPEHPWSRGGLCARGQANVLSLYDADRAHGPQIEGNAVDWSRVDARVGEALRGAAAGAKAIRLVAPPLLGPTAEAAVAKLLAAFPAARRVRHDPLGEHVVALAHATSHGVRATPAYHMERARVIVGVNADFLGTWIAPVPFTQMWAASRSAGVRHFQLEPRMSLTGAAADVRWTIAPSDEAPILSALAARLGARVEPVEPELDSRRLDRLAAELREHQGRSLVLTGSADSTVQALANAINQVLGNYGTTLDLGEGALLPEAMTMEELLAELRAGAVGVVIVHRTNPVYDHPAGGELGQLLSQIEVVSTVDRRDETGLCAKVLAPDHHDLESWGDAEPLRGTIGVMQPAVAPLYDTRSAVESLLSWAGAPEAHYDFMRRIWREQVAPHAPEGEGSDFDQLWDTAVKSGVARVVREPRPAPVYRAPTSLPPARQKAELELVPYASSTLGEGRLANNAWLAELPDPISKVTWGNVAEIAPVTAQKLGIVDGDLVRIATGSHRIELPALVQPGTHPRALAVAVGHGRKACGRIGNGVGVNAWPLWGQTTASLSRTGRRVTLARTQAHDAQEGRELARETAPGTSVPSVKGVHDDVSLWPRHEVAGHKWAMAIDLDVCTGCSACLIACQAENNVPIVGVDEVRRGREMHWIRIDRYYSGNPQEPEVQKQPMLCQHCENAPCETVCPVLATVHSSEGLNQQIYNRCVGTRYCANNCPVKVRRFNWWSYDRGSATERMVLNPDVVVRSRGVMEKCSFCAQRVWAAKAVARGEHEPLADGAVRTACQDSCPAGAISFGDLNDPKSRVAQLVHDRRAYRVLDELGIRSSVHYLARVRNAGATHE